MNVTEKPENLGVVTQHMLKLDRRFAFLMFRGFLSL